MLRLLLVLLAAAVTGLKLFSFRHVGADDPTVTLYAGAWTSGVNEVLGDLPMPEAGLIVLAEGENGFAFEDLYVLAMSGAWLIVAFCVVAVLLLGILRPRYGVRY